MPAIEPHLARGGRARGKSPAVVAVRRGKPLSGQAFGVLVAMAVRLLVLQPAQRVGPRQAAVSHGLAAPPLVAARSDSLMAGV